MSQDKIERWNEVDGNLDNSEKMQAFLDSTTDAYAILQLRHIDETVYEPVSYTHLMCIRDRCVSLQRPAEQKNVIYQTRCQEPYSASGTFL